MSTIFDPAHPFRETAVLKVSSLVDVFFIMVINRIERELNARAAAEDAPDEADQEAADERTGAEVGNESTIERLRRMRREAGAESARRHQ